MEDKLILLKEYKLFINRYEKLVIKDKNEINITTEDICILLNKEPGCFLKEIYNDLHYT